MKISPDSSNAGFLSSSFYEIVLLLFFQRPLKLFFVFLCFFVCSLLSHLLKFWPVYASHDLLWEAINFFFHSWSRFHSHIRALGQQVGLSVTNNQSDRIFPTKWMCQDTES